MTAYILDASVAAKWFLPSAGETLTVEALQLLKDYANGRVTLAVPRLANALATHFPCDGWECTRARQKSSSVNV